jgi:hypothetical protein
MIYNFNEYDVNDVVENSNGVDWYYDFMDCYCYYEHFY